MGSLGLLNGVLPCTIRISYMFQLPSRRIHSSLTSLSSLVIAAYLFLSVFAIPFSSLICHLYRMSVLLASSQVRTSRVGCPVPMLRPPFLSIFGRNKLQQARRSMVGVCLCRIFHSALTFHSTRTGRSLFWSAGMLELSSALQVRRFSCRHRRFCPLPAGLPTPTPSPTADRRGGGSRARDALPAGPV